MKRICCVLMAVVVLLFAVGVNASAARPEDETITIRAGHVNPPGEPAYEAWVMFKRLMEERLGDRVDVRLYPQAQLGGERDLIEQVRMGTLDMTAPAVSPLALHNSELDVLNLPYLFESEEQLWEIVDGPIGERLAESTLEKAGIKILDWWSTGVRHIFTPDRPLETPADMRGLTIRVMENPIFMAAFEALGASPQPLPYDQVYEALATGVVGAAENDSSGYRGMAFYEVAPYYSLTAHLIIGKPVLINPDFYNNLPDDVREVLHEVLAECTEFQRDGYATAFEGDVEYLTGQAGVTVVQAEMEQFQRAMLPVWDRFADEIGVELLQDVLTQLGIN